MVVVLELRGSGTVPGAAATAGETTSIELERIAPVDRWQRGADVRRKYDGKPLCVLVQGPGALNVARRRRIARIGVHQHVRRDARQVDHVREVNPVEFAKAKVGDEQVVMRGIEVRARIPKVPSDVHVGVVARRRGQGKLPESIRFY